MSNYARPSFFGGVPPAGRGTRWLCGLIIAVSVLAAVSGRSLGVGVSHLAFSAEAVMRGEVWRLLTHAFVISDPLGLMLRTVFFWFLGNLCEASWGTRDFVRFFLVSTIGGVLLAIPLSYGTNMLSLPLHDVGMADGPDAAFNAMMVALALNAPNAQVMFGFVLPMSAKNLIYALLALNILLGLMTGTTNMSITLGGMLMGYFLVTGNWRPDRMLAKTGAFLRRKSRRDRLYVVPPRHKKHNLN